MSKAISSLPVGAKVKDTGTTYYGSPIIWQVADKNHSGYPANSVTLIAANILKIAAFDAKESGNSDSNRRSYGNNRYALSNIRQWLNKSGSPWYVAQHSADAAPSSGNVSYNPYDGQSGFLTDFSAQMKAALLDTTLTVAKATVDGGGSESVVDKVFLLSKQEVGLGSENSIAEGSRLALFSSDNSSRLCKPTANAVSNSTYNNSSLSASQNWWWWLRSPDSSYSYNVRRVNTDGSSNYYSHAYYGNYGVRPALNLSSGILVSDSADSDGAYTIVWNQAPTTPPSITVPETIRSGKGAVITWAGSTDPEGGAVSYELERKINSGSFTQVYAGSALTYTDTGVGSSANTVQWRVRAKDNLGAYSSYLTGPSRTVVHNVDPTVSGSDTNLGTVTSPPSVSFTVNDADTTDELTVVKSLDDVEVDTIEDAVRNQTYTFALTAAQFAGLADGQHTMKVTVTDSAGNSATRTTTFTRSVSGIEFIVGPIETDAKAQKILVSLRYYAADSAVVLSACNNAMDASPTWETATPGLKHLFTNASKTAAKWAVGVKVKITKTTGYDEIWCQPPSGSYV